MLLISVSVRLLFISKQFPFTDQGRVKQKFSSYLYQILLLKQS
jgi:hypothetical protein